jgi:hypothetical protein
VSQRTQDAESATFSAPRRVSHRERWSDDPRPVVLGRSPEGIKKIREGKAHRCRVADCDALNPTEASHCPICHRSFASDRLDRDHVVSGARQEVLSHRDPPRGRSRYNRYGTVVWTESGTACGGPCPEDEP